MSKVDLPDFRLSEAQNGEWKRNAILFISSQTLSLLGSSLVQYAITWYITLQTRSGVMMAIAIICGFLPAFFVSPFAGVWADRFNRKIIICLSDSCIALATLIMAILFLMGFGSVWLLFVGLAVRGFGSGIQVPANGAFVPQMVPEEKLTKVNATNGSIQALIGLLSPMLSAALLTVFPIQMIFLVDVGTAAIGVITLLMFVRVPVHSKAFGRQTTSYFSDMREGLSYIVGHSYLRYFFVFYAICFFLATPMGFLAPLQVTRTFGGDLWRLTAIEVAFSVGMIAGGLGLASWGGLKNRIHTMVVAGLVIGFSISVLGVVLDFWLYLLFMGICGVFFPLFNTPSTVLLQEKVESEYLGRVFGVQGMITCSVMPLGMAIFGPMADIVRIEWLLIGSGVLIMALALAILSNKTVVWAGKPVSSNAECSIKKGVLDSPLDAIEPEFQD